MSYHLLTVGRPRVARPAGGRISVCLHIAAITDRHRATACRSAAGRPRRTRNSPRIVTPLIEPLTEFTQAERKGQAQQGNRYGVAAAARPIQAPKAAPSTTRPMAQRPAPIPTPPQPAPASLPEPPKLEAVVKEPPKIELPPTIPLFRPRRATVEKPKIVLENVGGPPAPPPRPRERSRSQHVGGRRHTPDLAAAVPAAG